MISTINNAQNVVFVVNSTIKLCVFHQQPWCLHSSGNGFSVLTSDKIFSEFRFRYDFHQMGCWDKKSGLVPSLVIWYWRKMWILVLSVMLYLCCMCVGSSQIKAQMKRKAFAEAGISETEEKPLKQQKILTKQKAGTGEQTRSKGQWLLQGPSDSFFSPLFHVKWNSYWNQDLQISGLLIRTIEIALAI